MSRTASTRITDSSMWVFGYGSLVWKADFPFRRKMPGYIKGYLRRLYQASPDHRGTPEKPGLVPTLIPSSDPEARVWGVAYEIAPADVNVVSGHLDYRERAGYEKKIVMFYPRHCDHLNNSDIDSTSQNNSGAFEAVAYVGLRSNPYYVEHESVEDIARLILEAKGESGSNKDYLFKLAESMHEITPEFNDEHLNSLVAAVKNLEQQKSCPM